MSPVDGPGPEGFEVEVSPLFEVEVLPYPEPVPIAEDTAPPIVGPPSKPEIELAMPTGPPINPTPRLVAADTGLFNAAVIALSRTLIPVTSYPGPFVVLLLAVGLELDGVEEVEGDVEVEGDTPDGAAVFPMVEPTVPRPIAPML